jgi:hypothetical protein
VSINTKSKLKHQTIIWLSLAAAALSAATFNAQAAAAAAHWTVTDLGTLGGT